MAGLPWFELDVDFHDHPKTIALRVALGNPLAEAYVSRLWAYCYRHATDRFGAAAGPATIEQAASWKGKTGRLVSVLESVGFVDREGESYVVHGVLDRLGPHLAKRDRDVTRARERRANVAATSPRHSVVVAGDRDRDRDKEGSDRFRTTPQPSFPPLRGAGEAG